MAGDVRFCRHRDGRNWLHGPRVAPVRSTNGFTGCAPPSSCGPGLPARQPCIRSISACPPRRWSMWRTCLAGPGRAPGRDAFSHHGGPTVGRSDDRRPLRRCACRTATDLPSSVGTGGSTGRLYRAEGNGSDSSGDRQSTTVSADACTPPRGGARPSSAMRKVARWIR
jgi:hypothetical protein